MQKVKQYLVPLLMAIFQFLITICFKFDRFYFDYTNIKTEHLFFMRVLYFIFLAAFWNFVFYAAQKIKSGDILFKRGFKIFLIYFSIMFSLLLLVWPGTWHWDDLMIMSHTVSFNFLPWQHILTSIEQITFAQTLPFIGGITLIRNLIISLLVAFCIVQLETTFNLYLKNKFFDYVLKFIPFLLLPILYFQFSGFRMGFYVYIEMAMLVLLICAIKNKKALSNSMTILFIILAIFASTWRSESLLYMPMICILLLSVKHLGSFKKRLAAIILIIIGVLSINLSQSYFLKKDRGNNYKIVATIRQATVLVRKADGRAKSYKDLNTIKKVLDFDIIRKYPEESGDVLWWKYGVLKGVPSDELYHDYLKAVFKLFLKYPGVVFKERTDTFLVGSGIKYQYNQSGAFSAVSIFDDNALSPFVLSMVDKNKLNRYISKKLRRETCYILSFNRNEILYKIVWNSLFPFIAIFAYFIYVLIKRKWAEAFIGSIIIAKLFLVFLTVPAKYFMYYLSFYQIGYIIIFYAIIKLICMKKEVKNV